MSPDDVDTRPIRKPVEPTPVMQYVGLLRVYFNRLSAEPMMWCVSPEDGLWELAVSTVQLGPTVVAETVWRPKATPDDEDGRPSAWLATAGTLRVFDDGTATITGVTP